MNPWLQRKTYTCVRCGKRLLHDLMHHHVLFECPMREQASIRRQPKAKSMS
jgi:predicted RNA-binding Zn-ribbon protein involved in translation (DUF1610 family)